MNSTSARMGERLSHVALDADRSRTLRRGQDELGSPSADQGVPGPAHLEVELLGGLLPREVLRGGQRLTDMDWQAGGGQVLAQPPVPTIAPEARIELRPAQDHESVLRCLN